MASLVLGYTLEVFFSVAMIGLAWAILYSTSNVLHYYRTDRYVAASLSLSAALALFFYYVLMSPSPSGADRAIGDFHA